MSRTCPPRNRVLPSSPIPRESQHPTATMVPYVPQIAPISHPLVHPLAESRAPAAGQPRPRRSSSRSGQANSGPPGPRHRRFLLAASFQVPPYHLASRWNASSDVQPASTAGETVPGSPSSVTLAHTPADTPKPTPASLLPQRNHLGVEGRDRIGNCLSVARDHRIHELCLDTLVAGIRGPCNAIPGL